MKQMRYIAAAFSVFVLSVSSVKAQVVATKTATDNHDGTYTLTMEAYATGTQTISESATPLDVVMALDVSGSMQNRDIPTGFSYTASNHTFSNYGSNSHRPSSGTSYYVEFSPGKWYKVTYGSEKKNGVTTYTASFRVGIVTYTISYNSNTGSRTLTTEPEASELSEDQKLTLASAVMSKPWSTRTSSTNVRRDTALVRGCLQFLETIHAKEVAYNEGKSDAEKVHHRISIVTWGSTASNKLHLTSGEVVDDYETLKTTIRAVKGINNNGTQPQTGLTEALTELQANAFTAERSKSQKIVIFFTDGTPGNSGFSTSVATSAISKANEIKNAQDPQGESYGVKIFALNVLENAGNDTENMDKYMNYVSSNYPNARSMTSSGTKDASFYYMLATDQEALNEAFTTISSTVGGTNAKVDQSTSVQDAISDSFKVPAGNANAYYVEFDHYVTKSDGTYGFEGNPKPAPQIPDLSGETIIVTNDKDNNLVTVSGFNFKEHWVGQHIKDGVTYADGYKLILKVVVVPDPTATGGYVNTNDRTNSGLILSDGTKISFNPQPVNLYTDVDMKISVTGLRQELTETFIVKVQSDVPLRTFGSSAAADFIRIVPLTSVENLVTLKVPTKYYDTVSGTEKFVNYTVSVLPWDWAYTVDYTSQSKTLYLTDDDGDAVDESGSKISETNSNPPVLDNHFRFVVSYPTDPSNLPPVHGEGTTTNPVNVFDTRSDSK